MNTLTIALALALAVPLLTGADGVGGIERTAPPTGVPTGWHTSRLSLQIGDRILPAVLARVGDLAYVSIAGSSFVAVDVAQAPGLPEAIVWPAGVVEVRDESDFVWGTRGPDEFALAKMPTGGPQ